MNNRIAKVLDNVYQKKGFVIFDHDKDIYVYDDEEAGVITTGIQAGYVDSYSCIYLLIRMLEDGKANIVFSDDEETKKNIEFIRELNIK